MGTYIGVYNKNNELILWVSKNDILGAKLSEIYNVPNSAYYDEASKAVKEVVEKLFIKDIDNLIDSLERDRESNEKSFLAKLAFDKTLDSTIYRDEMDYLFELSETLGKALLLNRIILDNNGVYLQVS